MPDALPTELQDSIDQSYLETDPKIMELIHGWLYEIVAAAYEGISELPPEYRDAVLMKISRACSEQAKLVVGCNKEWEDYKKYMAELEPPFGPRKITQIGDIVHWTYVPPKDEHGKAICQCPLVRYGMMEGRPELCACSANSVASYINDSTGVEVETVEVLGSPLVNGENECRYLVHLKPSAFTTPNRRTCECAWQLNVVNEE